jgi:hypothetical protein
MKLLLVSCFSALLFLFTISCDSNEPPTNTTLSLTLEDVSCTEAWLQLTTNNIQLPATINLLKNNSVTQTFCLSTQDSLLYIDSLLPNQSYKFKVVLNTANNPQPTTNEVLAQTLDTTSHNFTWQTFEFGQHSSSILYDVAIIDENNIWAVGRIYLNDSLGIPDLVIYNAVHWNGTEWSAKKIPYNYQGSSFYSPIKSVIAFEQNDIWFCGNGVINWDGINFVPISIPTSIWGPYQMNKIWGISSNELYIVGSTGNIVRFNGSNWQKIVSGTDLSLTDLTGNDKGEVYACGLRTAQGKGIVLKTANGFDWQTIAEGDIVSATQIFKPKLYGSISSVWSDQNNTLYAAGNLFYQYKFSTWSYVKSLPENFIGGNLNAYYRGFINKVKGNAANDMWVVGDRNTVRHFNGVSWKQIGLPYDSMSDIIWLVLSVRLNIVAISGMKGNKAFIMIAKR